MLALYHHANDASEMDFLNIECELIGMFAACCIKNRCEWMVIRFNNADRKIEYIGRLPFDDSTVWLIAELVSISGLL